MKRRDLASDVPPKGESDLAAAPAMPEASVEADIDLGAADLLAGAAAAASDLGSSATALREVRDRLAVHQAAAMQQVEELERFEQENVLDASDEILDANATKILQLRRRALRFEKWRERISGRLAGAEEQEAEDARRVRYDAAVDLVSRVETWIRSDFATACSLIADGLTWMGTVESALEAANNDRPRGAERLELEAFRALAATPATTSHRPSVTPYYVNEEGTEIVPSDALPLGQDPSGQFWIDRRRVYARHRDEAVHVSGRPRVDPRPLAVAVRLPGVNYTDPDFWPRRSKAWES